MITLNGGVRGLEWPRRKASFSKKCEERRVSSNSFQFYFFSHLTFYTYLNTFKARASFTLHAGSDQRQ